MELVSDFAKSRDSIVIAPAGYGKTNLIALATAHHNSGHELILTHTNAGVYALRNRLRQFGTDPNSYLVDTIAGWSLRYSAAYTSISGLVSFKPGVYGEWDDVYRGMIRLLDNSTIQEIIRRSYSGIYVDEYQDCLKSQHLIIRKLASIIPCRIVGDPLQGIFGFGQNQLADWDSEVMTSFKKLGELDTPWRWANTNPELGQWLKMIRKKLINKEVIDLISIPKTIHWIPLSDSVAQRKSYWKIGNNKNETTCIIHGGWEKQCHALARETGGYFNSLETIECKDLLSWALELDTSRGLKRVQVVCDFASECCTGVKTILKDVTKRLTSKRRKMGSSLDEVFKLLDLVSNEEILSHILPALEAIRQLEGVKLFRTELYYEMCRSLTEYSGDGEISLQDCAVIIRERTRQFGRRIAPRIVSRTLLIKGLEFDNCMIIGTDSLDRNNLYVALTRGTKTLTIVSQKPMLNPN